MRAGTELALPTAVTAGVMTLTLISPSIKSSKPNSKRLTADDVRKMLAAKCAEEGGQKYWAAQHGVSAAYVCDVLQGRREPGDAICNGLGLAREIAYKHIV